MTARNELRVLAQHIPVENRESRALLNEAIKRINYIAPSGVPASVTGGAYTFVLSDANILKVFDSASAQTITIPANSTVPYEIGTRLPCFRRGAGLVTFSPAGGVTLRLPTDMRPNRFLGASVKKAADQTAANYTALTNIAFDAETHDDGGWHDNVTNNDRLTVPSGLGIKRVDISGSVRASLQTADTWSSLRITKAGGAFDGAPISEHDGPNATHRINVAANGVLAAAGDVFRLAYQTESDISITIDAAATNFQIVATSIDAQGTIAYQYGAVELAQIALDEWVFSDQSALG